MSRSGTLAARRPLAGRPWLRTTAAIVIGAVCAAVIVVGVVRAVDPLTPAVVVGIGLLLLGIAVLFVVPVHVLPATALVVFALVPLRLVPSDGPFNAFPPLSAILLVWVLRRVVFGQRPDVAAPPPDRRAFGARYAVYATAGLLFAWLIFSTLRSSSSDTSVGWTLSFAVSALCVLLVFDARREAAALTTAWIAVGGALGLYALVELLLGASPAYGTIYALVGGAGPAPWSVYRAEASFGHPLFAGAFLTIPAALGIGTWLRTGRTWQFVCGAASAVGIAATVSRGSILGVGIAMLLIVVLAPFVLRGIWGRWMILVAGIAAGGIGLLGFEPLMARQESMESALSLGARDRAFEVAVTASQYSGWLGTGPGTSGITGRLFDPVVIENSALQLMISIGIPGLVLFTAYLATLAVCALAHRNVGIVGAIVGYAVSITGFNSLDALRNMHILLGLIAIIAIAEPLDRRRAASAAALPARTGREVVPA